jgi:hypothetical protein
LDLLTQPERSAARQFGEFLRAIERESITKSYKLVTLQAVVELGGLSSRVSVASLAARSREIMRGDPRLAADVAEHLGDPDRDWERYWREWPIAAWTGRLRGADGTGLFRIQDDDFVPSVGFVSDLILGQMVAELVDYRLCRYLDGKARTPGEWRLRVSQSNDRPLIWLDRPRNAGLPDGEAELIVDGRRLTGVFVKIALNVVREADGANRLPEILRSWFGENAGSPGTNQTVLIRQESGALTMQPLVGEDGETPSSRQTDDVAP